MRSIARITRGERTVQELAKLFSDSDAHADHGTTSAKRRDHRVAIFERGAATDGDRLLSFAGKSLRRDLALLLPPDERVFEQSSHEQISVEAPFESFVLVAEFRR